MVRWLLDQGVHVNQRGRRRGAAALMAASVEEQVGMVEFLLDKGADVNAINLEDHQPTRIYQSRFPTLHAVLLQVQDRVVTLLLCRRADVRARDRDGLTPWAGGAQAVACSATGPSWPTQTRLKKTFWLSPRAPLN
jgi:uncharacterized protein